MTSFIIEDLSILASYAGVAFQRKNWSSDRTLLARGLSLEYIGRFGRTKGSTRMCGNFKSFGVVLFKRQRSQHPVSACEIAYILVVFGVRKHTTGRKARFVVGFGGGLNGLRVLALLSLLAEHLTSRTGHATGCFQLENGRCDWTLFAYGLPLEHVGRFLRAEGGVLRGSDFEALHVVVIEREIAEDPIAALEVGDVGVVEHVGDDDIVMRRGVVEKA